MDDLLYNYNIAAVAIEEPLLPPEIRLTSDIAYVRWHGRGKNMWYNYRYSKDEHEARVPKVKEMSRKAEVYGFFNNNYHGFAPENCIDVLEMLGVATPEQKEAKQHISDYWKGKVKGIK